MHRFYLPPGEAKGDALELTGRESHHAARVLRLRRGDEVLVLDGAGAEIFCAIEETARDRVALRVLRKSFKPPVPYQITLLQAVPKGKIIESIIQKSVELGAHRIVPLLTERVVAHLDDADATGKQEKWQTVAVEAIKQCGAVWLPRVEPPVTPKEFLARGEKFDLPLVASLQPGSRHAREYFQAYLKQHGRKPASVCGWVGPEGDFTPDEVRLIESTGALPITLGPLVLRVETAATYCLSILNHELQG